MADRVNISRTVYFFKKGKKKNDTTPCSLSVIYKGSLLGGEREREVGSRRACMHGLGYGDVCTRWLGTTHTHTDVHVTHVIAVVLCLVIGELTRGIASFVRISGRTYRRAVNCS